MSLYTIERAQPEKRKAVEEWLHGLDRVTAATRERIVTAWTSVWTSSTHATLDELPYSTLAPDFPLAQHVNEVTRTGLDLARRAEAEWGERVDPEIFVPIVILHDVDKPLLYIRDGGKVVYSALARALPHGVVGAMLLRELGFPDPVVATVATHAANAPFHGSTLEAYLLHYADFFSTDRALMRAGTEPFYQKHWR
jgi:putative nucleotidyltransferase with HDIG domain